MENATASNNAQVGQVNMPPINIENFITIQQAAALIGVTRPTVIAYARVAELPMLSLSNRKIYIERNAFYDWVGKRFTTGTVVERKPRKKIQK